MNTLLFLSTFFLLEIECAQILGVFPAPGYSQFILAEALMTQLATRGHHVTVISPYEPKNPPENYTTILTDDILTNSGGSLDLFGLESQNLFTNIRTTYEFGYFITEATLQNSRVQEFLASASSKQFDLVIVEQFFNEAMVGFAHQFNASLVLFSSQGTVEWNKHLMGNPTIPSIDPISYTTYTNQMDFWQRLRNVIGTIYNHYYRYLVAYPKQKEYFQRFFPTTMDFDQIIYNASLMLLNSHVTTSENSLLPYNMIEIGGFHIKQKPLSSQVQDILDKAQNGAILFSMGSNLNSSDLSNKTLRNIFKVFSKLKQQILWKFEKDLPDKPPNVFIDKWLKQSDILAHPNVQLFITHGGLLSTTEALFYGVPMVGVPIFGDQKMNVARACKNGAAVVIAFQDLSSEEKLSRTISEVLNNTKYQDNARKLSNLLRDRVVRPLDLAMYWIEYVIRHRGLHFEHPSLHLSWAQFYMLDIFGLALAFVIIGYVSLCCTYRILIKTKRQSKEAIPKKNKKKKQ